MLCLLALILCTARGVVQSVFAPSGSALLSTLSLSKRNAGLSEVSEIEALRQEVITFKRDAQFLAASLVEEQNAALREREARLKERESLLRRREEAEEIKELQRGHDPTQIASCQGGNCPRRKEGACYQWSLGGKDLDTEGFQGHQAWMLDRHLLLWGGCPSSPEEGGCFKGLRQYNLDSQLWSTLPVARLTTASGYSVLTGQAGALDPKTGRIYLFGGRQVNRGIYVNSLSFLFKGEPSWEWQSVTASGQSPRPLAESTLTLLPQSEDEADAAPRLVVIGGANEGGASNGVYVLTIGVWRWQQVTVEGVAPPPRKGHTATLHINRIIIFGGRNDVDGDLNDVHVLLVTGQTFRWKAVYPVARVGVQVPVSRSYHSATAVLGRIIIFGGCNALLRNCFNDIHALSTSEYVWEQVPVPAAAELVAPRGRHAMALTPELQLFLTGGCGLKQCFKDIKVLDLDGVCNEASCAPHGHFQQGRPGRAGSCRCDSNYAGKFCDEYALCPSNCHAPSQGTCVMHTDAQEAVCYCKSGFWGEACSLPLCPNNCSSHGLCRQTPSGTSSCECAEGFDGHDCSLTLDSVTKQPVKCSHHCSGHGYCRKEDTNETASCACLSSFAGSDCSLECPYACSEHGQCGEQRQCVCNPGFTGKSCNEFACQHNCSGHGLCSNGMCFCAEGFTGAYCQSDVSCSHHGEWTGDRCRCESGWGGLSCSNALSCPNQQCGGRGKCSQEGEKVFCHCDVGYSGEGCQIRACPTSPDPERPAEGLACANNGVCHSDGTCHCFPGWKNEGCTNPVYCPKNCTHENQGRCQEDGTCHCAPGFTGADCSRVGCLDECSRHGVCVNTTCQCFAGYSGKVCDVECPSLCSGRGTCLPNGECLCDGDHDGVDCSHEKQCPRFDGMECGGLRGTCHRASQICYCAPGYSGLNCGIGDGGCGVCEHGLCQHGHCFCDFGYTGPSCDIASFCPSQCRGRGVCSTGGRCLCDAGFEGEECELVVTNSVCPLNCSNRGVCHSGHCFCVDGFSGPLCQNVSGFCESHNCSNQGTCAFNRCFCFPGVSGTYCEIGGCSHCNQNNGICVLDKCQCFPGFQGPDCSIKIPCPGVLGPCSLHGACIDGKCACIPGFSGEDCSVSTDLSASCPNQCSNKGVCHMGTCFCLPGLMGNDCSIEVDSLCLNGCQPPLGTDNKGVCLGGRCFCTPGYEGPGCENVLTCAPECETNGVCLYGKCFCIAGYQGPTCQEVMKATLLQETLELDMLKNHKTTGACRAELNGCNQHGICLGDICACDLGYVGQDCSRVQGGPLAHRCPDHCNLHGQCLFGRCYCNLGYAGPSCAKQMPLPCPDDCNGRGICHYGICYCDLPFRGRSCQLNNLESGRDEMMFRSKLEPLSEPCIPECGPNGMCSQQRCYCTPGWGGTACDVHFVEAAARTPTPPPLLPVTRSQEHCAGSFLWFLTFLTGLLIGVIICLILTTGKRYKVCCFKKHEGSFGQVNLMYHDQDTRTVR